MALAGAKRIFDLIDEEPEVDKGVITLVNMDKNGNLSNYIYKIDFILRKNECKTEKLLIFQ